MLLIDRKITEITGSHKQPITLPELISIEVKADPPTETPKLSQRIPWIKLGTTQPGY